MGTELEEKPDLTGYQLWSGRIRQGIKDRKDWVEASTKIEKRYRDERPNNTSTRKKYNILWSNIQTMKPALYSNTPKPKVSRRHKDKDDLGRAASMVLERATSYQIDSYDFDEMAKACVEDYLLCGFGSARVRYIPTFGSNIEGTQLRELVFEEAVIDYFYWKDFIHGKARKWKKLPWIGFRENLTKAEIAKRFGEKTSEKVKYEKKDEDDKGAPDSTAIVWEIWDKKAREVIWWADNEDEKLLDRKPPPLNFKDFWPCPRPLLANTTNSNLIPVPDFTQYQDQAEEIDEITARISQLVKAIKVAGVYDASVASLERLIDSGENKLIPVDNWAVLAEKGGLKGVVDFMPLVDIANTIISLYEARDRTKQELFEISGLSDILRGASDPNETATAQRLKGQFGSMRLVDRQKEVSRFMRDLVALTAEVIAENFDGQTISLIINSEIPPEVIQLLKNDAYRRFRIDIETDSTLEPDEQAEKQSRIEFLEMSAGFMERMLPAVKVDPEFAPLVKEMLMFGVRGFRAGRDLEETFEQVLESITQKTQQAPPKDPEKEAKAAKMKQEMDIKALEVQNKQQLGAIDAQEKQIDLQRGKIDLAHGVEMNELEKQKKEQEIINASLHG